MLRAYGTRGALSQNGSGCCRVNLRSKSNTGGVPNSLDLSPHFVETAESKGNSKGPPLFSFPELKTQETSKLFVCHQNGLPKKSTQRVIPGSSPPPPWLEVVGGKPNKVNLLRSSFNAKRLIVGGVPDKAQKLQDALHVNPAAQLL